VWIPNFIKILQFLTLTEERRSRVFENRGLRVMVGIKGIKLWGTGENCILRSITICPAVQIFW